MNHSHEEYDVPEELIPKLKEYWKEPCTFSFNSKIKEINDEWVSLKTNYFYPEGGGQQPDLGYLILKSEQSKKCKIIDVQTRDNETWLKIPKHDLIEGWEVSAIIDKKRRISLSRNHSAQHLVSAIFWEELGFDTTRAEIREFESQVELDRSPTLDQISEVNKMITQLIDDKLTIESRYYQNLDQINLKIRGEMAGMDIYRLVTIGKYDLNPCGGTHVKNTSEIDSIFINKIESKKVRFLSGNNAKTMYSENSVNLIKLSRLTSVPFEKIPETVEDILNKKNQYEKRIHKLETQIIEIQNQLIHFEDIGNYRIKTYQVPTITKNAATHVNDGLQMNEVVLIVDEQGLFVLSTGSEKLTMKLIHSLRKLGVKSGGKGKFIMGKLGNLKIKEIKKYMSDLLVI
ncbi:MAG: alanine--tRNA ligase-related protein [Candidatus Heimdallarchaeota archaeon]